MDERTCSVEGCTRPWSRVDWCLAHYTRNRRGQPLEGPFIPHRPTEMSDLEWFWAAVDRSGGPDACWPWMRGLRRGYGRTKWAGRNRPSHVVAWEVSNGRTPGPDELVRHLCHNRTCCNPRHLAPGTQKDNMRDQIEANRKPWGTAIRSSKLTPSKVVTIRELAASGVRQRDIAAQFGVRQCVVSAIVRRTAWSRVP